MTDPIVHESDVVVVGAGPAGLAAAVTAAEAGCGVTLLDGAPRPGGQYWRHRPGDSGHGHHHWGTFQRLLRGLDRVDYRPEHAVWFAEADGTLHTARGAFRGRRTILATGAYDRAVPFPGWQLPGVMTAGAAQALAKGAGVAPGRRVVVAGTGPFLLPVACGLLDQGVEVAAVVEASHPARYLPHLHRVAPVAGKLGEAAGYAARLARARVPYLIRHAVVAAHAAPPGADATSAGPASADRLESGAGPVTGRVAAVTVADLRRGRRRRIDCDTLAVGYGFTAQLELPVAFGCATALAADGGLAVTVDQTQATTVAGVLAAGEVTGVGGAALALVEGRLAGLAAAAALGHAAPTPGRLIRHRRALRRFADALWRVHPVPPDWPDWSTADTLLCRCESVPIGAVAESVAECGVVDARGVKLMTRAGMGRCQGRVCGYATACLTARRLDRPVDADDLTAFATRPIATPTSLAELAGEPVDP